MICLESGGVSGICETRRLRRNGYTSVCGIDLKSVHLSFILFDMVTLAGLKLTPLVA